MPRIHYCNYTLPAIYRPFLEDYRRKKGYRSMSEALAHILKSHLKISEKKLIQLANEEAIS